MDVSYSRIAKVDGALMLNQSFRANGSVFFFSPFLPFDNLLFFPTAMLAVMEERRETAVYCGVETVDVSLSRSVEMKVRKLELKFTAAKAREKPGFFPGDGNLAFFFVVEPSLSWSALCSIYLSFSHCLTVVSAI